MRHALPLGILLFIALAGLAPPPATTGTGIPVGRFRSVTLHSGGEVILRHGSSHRVSIIEGGAGCARVEIEDGDHLVIERIHGKCGRYGLVVEVVTPEIAEVTVTDGGTLRAVDGFPKQNELVVTVENGGTIDARSLKPEVVIAEVNSGGRILTKSANSLLASVTQG